MSTMIRWMLACALIATPLIALAYDPGASKTAIQQDRVVAGSPTEFQEVRHLVLKGTNYEIGQALATLGRERFQLKPTPASDPERAHPAQVHRKELPDHV
jgi:hypothetical protein